MNETNNPLVKPPPKASDFKSYEEVQIEIARMEAEDKEETKKAQKLIRKKTRQLEELKERLRILRELNSSMGDSVYSDSSFLTRVAKIQQFLDRTPDIPKRMEEIADSLTKFAESLREIGRSSSIHTKGPETLSQLVNYINETDPALQAIENSGVEYTGPPMPPLHQLLSSRYNCLLSENVIMRGAQVEISEGGDQLRSAAGEENELDRAMVEGGDDASLKIENDSDENSPGSDEDEGEMGMANNDDKSSEDEFFSCSD